MTIVVFFVIVDIDLPGMGMTKKPEVMKRLDKE